MTEKERRPIALSVRNNRVCIKEGDGRKHERDITDEEQRKLKTIQDLILQDAHGVDDSFRRKFINKRGWKKNGYGLIRAVEEWAKKYPGWVHINVCDDDRGMTSALVFIQHGTDENYMGESVYYLPQHGPKSRATRFFLYPHHLIRLQNTLNAIHQDNKIEELTAQKTPSGLDAFFERWKTKKWYEGRLSEEDLT